MKITFLTRPAVLVAAFAVFAVLVLAACGGSSGSASSTATTPASPSGGSATTDQIAIQDFAFTPPETTVKAGTTVTWTNNDGAAHNVTSTDGPAVDAATTSAFTSGQLGQGQTFSFTFKKPGTYYYECTIHASMAAMHAVVIVE
jgi:plastocyanin